MDGFVRLWKGISTAATVYMLYKQLDTVRKAKETLYYDLSPEQQAVYEQVFGKPNVEIASPIPPPVSSQPQNASRPDQRSHIAQIQAGV